MINGGYNEEPTSKHYRVNPEPGGLRPDPRVDVPRKNIESSLESTPKA